MSNKLKLRTGPLWWQFTVANEPWYFDNPNDDGRYHTLLGLHWVERSNNIRGLQFSFLGLILICAWLRTEEPADVS